MGSDPPPNVKNIWCIFFLKLDHYWGTFWKKVFFPPRNVKHLQKFSEFMLSMGIPPPKADPKHNFRKCLILSASLKPTYTQTNFFLLPLCSHAGPKLILKVWNSVSFIFRELQALQTIKVKISLSDLESCLKKNSLQSRKLLYFYYFVSTVICISYHSSENTEINSLHFLTKTAISQNLSSNCLISWSSSNKQTIFFCFHNSIITTIILVFAKILRLQQCQKLFRFK